MEEQLAKLVNKALQIIENVKSEADLKEQELKALGRQGLINQESRKLLNLKNQDEKRRFGIALNKAKKTLNEQIQKKRNQLLHLEHSVDFDPTLPGKVVVQGGLHPITLAAETIVDIFAKIGFYKLSYPEIEYEYFAFDSLNMPSSHPARDDFESFSVNGPASSQLGKMVLSPHTSSGQVREMWRRGGPPIRMINIARCFRRNFDVTHTPMFHQFEGLCVDKNINIKHLKGAIAFFVKEYFGYSSRIRLRPHHFQFTEPSFEVDISCTVCQGSGKIGNSKCRVCKSGWLELGGCGMVHPYVLKEGKIDPNLYSGWAFGFGIERVLMMKYQLNDIRKLYSGEIDLYKKS